MTRREHRRDMAAQSASLPVGERQMHSVNKLLRAGVHRPDPRSTESHPRPAPGVRIWARLIAALHESRRQEAQRLICLHRDLIQNFQAIELAGCGVDPRTDA
jgi:hypothetical protein